MSDMNDWNGGERADDPFAPGMVEDTIAESLWRGSPATPAAVLVRSLADAYALPPGADAMLARSRATLARRAEGLVAERPRVISSDSWPGSAATTPSTRPPQRPRRQHSTFAMAWRTAAAVLIAALLSASFYALLHGIPRPGGHPMPTSTPSMTSTPALAPTPTNVPAGWKVLATPHFSLAYPPDWTPEVASDQMYNIWGPARRSAVQVTVVPQTGATSYCQPESSSLRHTTLANLPMTLRLTGLGNTVRVWEFVNAQKTRYLLSAGDVTADAATQAQDEAIFATFRPDNATPWSC